MSPIPPEDRAAWNEGHANNGPVDHDWLVRVALRAAIALAGIVAVVVWALATGGVAAS